MKELNVGVLALQGDVKEHYWALEQASKKFDQKINILLVKQKDDLKNLDGLIIPGGESTTISNLLLEFDMFYKIKKIPNLFGTCAGLILLSKKVEGLEKGQKTLGLMDIKVKRNAYGSQVDSFYAKLEGKILDEKEVAFIRAPIIKDIYKNVNVLSKIKNTSNIVIVEQKTKTNYLLGSSCHPELDYFELEEYFLKKILNK
jgi:5'-phosphate synthase pdxT subunit